jgi:hypothetical protein
MSQFFKYLEGVFITVFLQWKSEESYQTTTKYKKLFDVSEAM